MTLVFFIAFTFILRLVYGSNVPIRRPKIRVLGALSESSKTKCTHYHSDKDIIAIKLKCCNKYYSCIFCHNEAENHETQVWSHDEFSNEAILCGNCESLLSIESYLKCNSVCPKCKASFNPGCSNHYHYYFSNVSFCNKLE